MYGRFRRYDLLVTAKPTYVRHPVSSVLHVFSEIRFLANKKMTLLAVTET